MSIKNNLAQLRNEIEKACEKAGRNPEEIILVAVSKTVDTNAIKEASGHGCAIFGENRVQDLVDKYDFFNGNVNFHMIGHLQTNKVKYLIGKTTLIHSVDSIKLLDEIEKRAKESGIVQDVLLQVDVSKEESKFGVSMDMLTDMILHNEKNTNVKIKGLMTMAPICDNPEEIRWVFRKLRDIFIDIGSKTFYNTYMEYTSMGMSGDFSVAIEEGADIIRVGSKIFHDTY